MKVFDISLPVFEGMPVYPGNPPVLITAYQRIPQSQTNLSRIDFGSHTGTHIDTPRHVNSQKSGLEDFKLAQLVGPCRVLDVTQSRPAVRANDLDWDRIGTGDRLLFKTGNSLRGFERFYDDYVFLDGELAQRLAEKRAALVGIDALSVKQRGGKDLRPHTALLENNIVVIEGLDLSQVPAGEYFLVAAPLKFKNIDGAPARVFLIDNFPNGSRSAFRQTQL